MYHGERQELGPRIKVPEKANWNQNTHSRYARDRRPKQVCAAILFEPAFRMIPEEELGSKRSLMLPSFLASGASVF